MLAVRALNEEGYTAIAAEDGAAALEAMESGRVKPDLVVTDVIMPGLNGRQLHDAIVERWLGIPVLFIRATPARTPSCSGWSRRALRSSRNPLLPTR